MQCRLFQLLVRYAARNGGVMTREALADLLRDQKPGTALLYGEAYAALAATVPEVHAFRHAVDMLRDLASERATGDALAAGMQILREGASLDDGRKLRGYADAREYVLEALATAEQLGSEADTPEGDVTGEGGDVMAAYAKVKLLRVAGKPVGIQFGIPSLDRDLGGLGNGLCLVVAGTTVGKSSLCVQLAWHNAVMEGRNVQFFTTEQHRGEVRVKLVARHSRHPKFGLPSGLNSRKIRAGWLSEEEEKALDWVLSDLKGGGYGEIQVVQMPERCTVTVMAGRSEALARRMMPDVVIADYLQQFDPDQRVRDAHAHETQAGIVKRAHRWAQSCYLGRGVPLVSPWQANQGGTVALRGAGGFSIDEHMSQTSEAAKTAGVVLALGTSGEEDSSHGLRAPLRLSVVKNRDGARGAQHNLTADYSTSYFTDREEPDEGMAEELGLG